MGRVPSQLPLALTHPPEYGEESFIAGASNSAALSLVQRWPNWPGPVVLLRGPAGSGKTHLAHIWAERAAGTIFRAADLAAQPLVFDGRHAIAVEDVPVD